MEIEVQGIDIEHIGFVLSDQSKGNQRIAEQVDKIKARRLDKIGDGAGAGADPEEAEEAEEVGRWEGRVKGKKWGTTRAG